MWPLEALTGVDHGLGSFLTSTATDEDLVHDYSAYAADADGLFKVSTLRNLTRTAPYGHNGYFATLKDIVHFYNTAGDGTWPAPEVPVNVNRTELGNLGLTDAEEDAIVAFLKTLTDRVIVNIPIQLTSRPRPQRAPRGRGKETGPGGASAPPGPVCRSRRVGLGRVSLRGRALFRRLARTLHLVALGGGHLQQVAVCQAADDAADGREDDEHPELGQRPIADEERRSESSAPGSPLVLVTGMLIRWISVRVRPIASGARPAGARLSVTPWITSRNAKVRSSSITIAAASE